MSKIHRLSETLTNLIAAGEVVERPRGVVKELVENSLDAHASRIVIRIVEGGLKKIEIEDNGIGMDEEDSLIAFERHATSKIETTQDLFRITTMGFRGEALASIASVASVTMETNDGSGGTCTKMAYGKLVKHETIPCPLGTKISVEDLFYETPARLKHMRSAQYEASLVQSLIFYFAFGHPQVAFVFMNEEKEVFRTSGNGDMQEILYKIFGKDAASSCIPLHCQSEDYEIDGVLVKPFVHRSSRSGICMYLNTRMVKERRLEKAVEEGYGTMLPQGRYPIAIIHVKMDPHIVDVNVHPSKWEVRLSKENQLLSLLKSEINNALTQTQTPKPTKVKAIPTYNKTQMKLDFSMPAFHEAKKNFITPTYKPERHKQEPPQHEEMQPIIPTYTLIGIYKKTYALAETAKGLCIFDLQRIRKRIRYEKLLAAMHTTTHRQQLTLPCIIRLKKTDVERIEELNKEIKETGIVYETFGDTEVVVREIPTWLTVDGYEVILRDICENYFNQKTTMHFQETIAKKILANSRFDKTSYTKEEAALVLEQLRQCKNQYSDPNGNALTVLIDDYYLLKNL